MSACPYCRGSGRNLRKSVTTYHPCVECDGTGFQPDCRIVTDDYDEYHYEQDTVLEAQERTDFAQDDYEHQGYEAGDYL